MRTTTHPMADLFLAACFALLLSGAVVEVARAFKAKATCEATGGEMRGDRCIYRGERR